MLLNAKNITIYRQLNIMLSKRVLAKRGSITRFARLGTLKPKQTVKMYVVGRG